MSRLRRSPLRACRKSESGITLVEVLAAMIVLAVGILSMAPMMVLSITGSRFSNDVTALASEAQRSIESQIGKGVFPSMPYTQTEVADGKYTVTTVVLDDTVDPSIPSRLYEVNVTVSWTDDADLDRSMAFTTYATKK